MPSTETPARDGVIAKYLNEAYGKEKQLETELTRLVALSSDRKPLQKGFRDHLKVTRNQSKGLERRIRALGEKAIQIDLPGPDVASNVATGAANLANRALAAAKGPVATLRGTGESDNLLRNVRDAYWNEAEEIGHYNVIEAIATELKDNETAKLARQFRREEERFQTFLGRQINQLVKAVVRDEVPAAERRAASNGGSRRRSSSGSSSSGTRSRSASASSRSSSRSSGSSSSRSSGSTSTRKKSTGSSSSGRTAASRRSAAQKAAATRTRKSATASAKRTASSARTTAKKAGTTAKKGARAARSTAKRATT